MRRLLLAAGLALLLGCTPLPDRTVEPPPRDSSPEHAWAYALDLLREGDDQAARAYLERALDLGADRWPPPDSFLFLRDLAEVRLATGDGPGTVAAAAAAAERLQRIPTAARFREDDRRLQARLVDALRAAGAADADRLEDIARSAEQPPAADPWFLLGGVRERQGDAAAARQAFRAYLDRSPEHGFLRRSLLMRRQAEGELAG